MAKTNLNLVFDRVKIRGIFAYGLGPMLGLISGPILAQSLKPVGRGQFASVMEPLTIAAAVASVGIPTAITYFISRGGNPQNAQRLAFLFGLIPTILVCIFLWLYSGPVSDTQNLPRGFVAGAWSAVILSVAIQIRRAYWQGLAGWLVLDVERLFFSIARFLAIIISVIIGAQSVQFFVFAVLLAFIFSATILWLPWKRNNLKEIEELSRTSFVRYSVLAAVGSIAIVANNRLDQVLMPAQTSSSEMGFYAVAVTVAEVPLVFVTLAARDTLQLSGSGKPLKQILKHNWLYFAGVLVTSICLGLGANWYLPLFFGLEFSPAIIAIHILCIGTIFSTVAVVSISLIAGRGAPILSSLVPLIGLVVTLIAFYSCWNKVDATVASWISLGAQGSSAIVGLILTWIVLQKIKLEESSTKFQ